MDLHVLSKVVHVLSIEISWNSIEEMPNNRCKRFNGVNMDQNLEVHVICVDIHEINMVSILIAWQDHLILC